MPFRRQDNSSVWTRISCIHIPWLNHETPHSDIRYRTMRITSLCVMSLSKLAFPALPGPSSAFSTLVDRTQWVLPICWFCGCFNIIIDINTPWFLSFSWSSYPHYSQSHVYFLSISFLAGPIAGKICLLYCFMNTIFRHLFLASSWAGLVAYNLLFITTTASFKHYHIFLSD